MKKSIIVLALAALTFSAACQKFQESEGGMLYKVVTDKGQEKIKEGDFVSFGAVIKTDSDSTLLSTYDSGQPSFMAIQAPMFAGDIMSAFLKLGSGDSAIFKLNIDSMEAHGMPRPPETKGTHIVYEIKVNHVIPKGELTDSAFHSQIEKYIESEQEKVKNAEAENIKKYIEKNKLNVKTTASGINYVIETEGKGPVASIGDTVVVDYTGRFLHGKAFDTSFEDIAKKESLFDQRRPYEPIRIPAGLGNVIPGWDEALTTFPEGTKALIILPSKLAYGEQGAMTIGPYTPLVFEIVIVDVIPQKGETKE